MSDHIHENLNDDGVDRRGFLKCMAWAGTGLVFTMGAGIARSRMLLAPASDQGAAAGELWRARYPHHLRVAGIRRRFDRQAVPALVAAASATAHALGNLYRPVLHQSLHARVSKMTELD